MENKSQKKSPHVWGTDFVSISLKKYETVHPYASYKALGTSIKQNYNILLSYTIILYNKIRDLVKNIDFSFFKPYFEIYGGKMKIENNFNAPIIVNIFVYQECYKNATAEAFYKEEPQESNKRSLSFFLSPKEPQIIT